MTPRKGIAVIGILAIMLFQVPGAAWAEEAPPADPPAGSAPPADPVTPAAPESPAAETSGSAPGEAPAPEASADTPEASAEEASTGETVADPEMSSEEVVEFQVETTGDQTEEETIETTSEVLESVTDELGEAASGDAAASTGSGGGPAEGEAADGPAILSGDAVATANILNIVNTSMINSTGAIIFSNVYDEAGAIDLRGASGTDSTCAGFLCGAEVTLNMLNDAVIDNLISIFATSGQNTIEDGGDAAIGTGDAYAGLNLINIANTTFVDADYLLVALNAFGDVNGDIILPSLDGLLQCPAPAGAIDAAIANAADVQNDVEVIAESGNNLIEDAEGMIETGDSMGSSNVFNQINSTQIGGNSIMILFRVHGDWTGDVIGAPEGLTWDEDENGSIFMHDSGSTTAANSTLAVAATSSALINNDVSVVALTGENTITDAETAVISTGNAYAGANIVNIANTNVVGCNWMRAIINIFGDFNGNISFGLDDLWVGEQIQTDGLPMDGRMLTYKFTVINNGDRAATGVTLTDDYAAAHIDIVDSSLAYELNGDDIVWQLGSIPKSGAVEVTYRGRIKDAPPGTAITNTVTVAGDQTDSRPEDNTDTATVVTVSQPTNNQPAASGHPTQLASGGGGSSWYDYNNAISMFRKTATSTVIYKPDRKAHQEFTVKNTARKELTGVVVHDIMRDPDGDIIGDEVWHIGKMAPDEEIVISYDVHFSAQAPWGEYLLSTLVSSAETGQFNFHGNGVIFLLPSAPLFPGAPFEVTFVSPRTPEAARLPEAVQTATIERPLPPLPDLDSFPSKSPPRPAAETQAAAAAVAWDPLTSAKYLWPLLLGGFGIFFIGSSRRRERKIDINI